MTIDVHRSQRSRHLVVRQSGGALPEALLERLRQEKVLSGWLRASGVLAEVELRTFDPRAGGLGAPRRLTGPLQALTIEGFVGAVHGVAACSLRAVLSREGHAGHEVFCGEIHAAQAVALEALVTVLDDVVLARALDEAAGVWLVAPAGEPAAAAGGPRSWSSAVAASDDPGAAPKESPPAVRMPQRPARQAVDLDTPVPEAGDTVEHFAFGRCEVIKSDGDRLHLRMAKDGRIKEIALDMLRVTPVGAAPPEGDAPPRRHFKLDRKL